VPSRIGETLRKKPVRHVNRLVDVRKKARSAQRLIAPSGGARDQAAKRRVPVGFGDRRTLRVAPGSFGCERLSL
jgi:hypothetical protein